RLMWQVAGRRVLPALRTMLEDTSGPVRVSVLEVFGESGDPSAIEVAHRVLEHDSSPVVRATAIQVIGRAGLDQRTTALAEALDHLTSPDVDDRMLAIALASRSGTTNALHGIIRTLVDPLPAVRRAGATALAEIRSPEAIPPLAQALNDPEPTVREEALRALADIDDEQVLDPLINALKD